MEKKKLTIGLLGQEGDGKSTLLAAISKTLWQKYGITSPVSVEKLDAAERDYIGGTFLQTAVAFCETPERVYTFLDFPSHQDAVKGLFVSEMKLDGVILVVAANNGVLAQTRDQLLLAHRLGISDLLVVLSRCDLVDDEELLESVEMEIQETLDDYGFDGYNTEIIRGALDSRNPERYDPACIGALIDHIDTCFHLPNPAADEPFLMPVENFSSIVGRGVLASGKIERGTIRTGDTLELVGFEPTQEVKAGAIDRYGRMPEKAGPGDIISVLLPGVPRTAVRDGQVLSFPGSIKAGQVYEAELYVNRAEEGNTNKPLVSGTSVNVELRTATVQGVITFSEGMEALRPSCYASARLELSQPLALEEGTHFILIQNGHRVAVGFISELPDSLRSDSRKQTDLPPAAAPKESNASPDEAEAVSASECYDRGESAWNAEDYQKAAHWYAKAAEHGDARAQNDLGFCYRWGKGVTPDDEKALYWYTKAAEQGLALALLNLGDCFDEGIGVEKSPEKAVYWFRLAAEKGDPVAQFNMGYCYENGDGVARDLEKAVYWYQKAADQGDEDAEERLEELTK